MSTNKITVADYMTRKLITLTADMDITEAINLFIKHKISGAPVVKNNELVGMFSEADSIKSFLSCAYNEEAGCGRVGDFMNTTVVTLDANDDLVHAAQEFSEKGRRRMPVMKNGNLVGQISRHDLLKAIKDMGWH